MIFISHKISSKYFGGQILLFSSSHFFQTLLLPILLQKRFCFISHIFYSISLFTTKLFFVKMFLFNSPFFFYSTFFFLPKHIFLPQRILFHYPPLLTALDYYITLFGTSFSS